MPLREFTGKVRVGQLQESCDAVPNEAGVYVIVRRPALPVHFTRISTGGHFKGKDPTVAVAELRRKWVPRAEIIYIGKAGPGQGSTLRSRLRQYMRFGLGRRYAHWGGRYVWQLADARDLLVFWTVVRGRDPADVEQKLLSEFKARYGTLPFANLRN